MPTDPLQPSAPRAAPLPRRVILLGWVSFFADVSGEMIYPLLPLFLVGVLGASATSLGWVEGIAMALVAVMGALAGWRSDRVVRGLRRRVPWLRWGYGLPVVGKSILAVSIAWPMVLAGRTVDRLGKGLRGSPRDALIADTVPAPDRGRAFGFHRAMDTAGAMLGVLLAALLLWWFTGTPTPVDPGVESGPVAAGASDAGAFRAVFAVAAGLGLVSWIITFFVRESAPVDESSSAGTAVERPARSEAAGALPRLPASYWKTLALLLIFALANSSDTFLLLRAADTGLSPWAVVLAYALLNLTYTLAAYPAGLLSDRVGRWRLIGAGWAIYAVVYVGFAFTGSAGVWPLMALYGLYMALTDGVGKALIADHAPKERRGTAMGIYYMASGLVTLVASVAAGVLWDLVGPSATFLFGAGTAVVALALLPVLHRAASRRGGFAPDHW